MKFKLDNSKYDAKVIVEHNNTELEFPVNSLINRRLRDPIDPDKLFFILNSYLDYKGRKFQDELFAKYEKSDDELLEYSLKKDLEPLPVEIFHRILDSFSLEDVIDFIKKTKIITPPSKLGDVFDERIERDERGSRVQTYLKEDYIGLIALVTILKAIFPLIGKFAHLKSGVLTNNPYREVIYLQLIITHPIAQTKPFVKVKESIEKLVNRLENDEAKITIRILEKNVSKASLTDYLLAKVIVEKIFTNNELEDSNMKSTITKIYNYCSNQLKFKSNVSDIKIRHFNNGEGDNESESNLESFRTPSNVTVGNIEEFRAYVQQPEILIRDLRLDTTMEEFQKYKDMFATHTTFKPLKENIYITSYIFKNIMDPRGIMYLKKDELFNLMSIAYIWLMKNNFHKLAIILASYDIRIDGVSVIKLSSTVKNKIDPELKERLNQYFPYKRLIKSGKNLVEKDYVEETLGRMIQNLQEYSLRTIAFNEDIIKAYGKVIKDISIHEDIKNDLIRMLLRIIESKK